MPFAFYFFEVMDKEPSLEFLFAASLGLGGAAFFLGRKNPLLAIPFGLVLISLLALFHSEVTNPFVGPDIVREAGAGYVTFGYVWLSFGMLLTFGGVLEWTARRIFNRGDDPQA